MEKARRDFLKAAAGLPILWKTMAVYGSEERLRDDVDQTRLINQDHKCQFNLARFAAPPIENLRVGYIGMGNRGLASIRRLSKIEGVEIRAIGDCYEYPITQARDYFASIGYPPPAEYYASEDSWRDLVARDDLDLVIVTTPQWWHAEMACGAMEAGKHAATEVPLAFTLADCWRVVETSERTKRHCALLENCCYDFFEAMTTNMALQGVFGELVYGAGAYIHYISPISRVFDEPMPPFSKKAGPYRTIMSVLEKGNRYPTHGFGPICKAMRINAGDRPDYLVSMETDDFVLRKKFEEVLKEGKQYHKQFVGKTFSSNLNISLVRTVGGKGLQVQWGQTSLRPYSRIHELSGLDGYVQKYPLPGRIYFGDEPVGEEQMRELEERYTPELIKTQQENAMKFGGHGGMDYICDYRLIDCLRNGLPLDITAYDAAAWSAITPLSLWSATHGSQPIPFPDFTGGTWKENPQLDLSLRGGGTTAVKAD
ncbi:MAG: Gfo/Idh/MocA family oxidoreductase [Thermoguttaceae bacterium]|nr:Gfo/Idh/MocA family oxidoreductase [Thermoguttaceae bacterium]